MYLTDYDPILTGTFYHETDGRHGTELGVVNFAFCHAEVIEFT